MKGLIKITEFPASLNKGDFRVMNEKWYGAPEKIRLGLEISVKDCHVVAHFDVAVLHAFSKSPCFVPIPVVSDLVLYVYAFACPSLAL